MLKILLLLTFCTYVHSQVKPADCGHQETTCPETAEDLPPLIVPPFSNGIHFYRQIITTLRDSLARFNGSEFLAKPIDNQTALASRQFVRNVQMAANTAQTVRQYVDSEVLCRVAVVSIFEAKINCFNGKIAAIEADIVGNQRLLDIAVQSYNEANSALTTANAAVVEAEEKLNHYRYCLSGNLEEATRSLISRVKRFNLGQGLNNSSKGVEVGRCALFNYSVIQLRKFFIKFIGKAKDEQTRAKAQVDRNRMQIEQNRQAELKANLNAVQVYKGNTVGSRNAAQLRLTSLVGQQEKVLLMSEKLKRTATHIEAVAGRSHEIKRQIDVGILFDTENVVVPLQEIASLIEGTTGNSALNWLNQLSAQEIGVIRQQIAVIIQLSNQL